MSEEQKKLLEAIKEESLMKLGYFLKPQELFSELAKKRKCRCRNLK